MGVSTIVFACGLVFVFVFIANVEGRCRRHSSSSESSESHGSSSESHESHEGGDDEEEIYRFMIGRDFGPYEYIDERTGVRNGFHVDLLRAVCHEAGKRCSWLLDSYTNCWDVDHPGQAILGGWYEACIGVYPTPERRNSLNFSNPHTENFKVSLHYKAGDIVGDPADLTGRSIGFVKGWAMSSNCLSRQSELSGTDDYNPVFFKSHDVMLKYLLAGRIDAILAMPQYLPEDSGLQSAGPSFYCTDGGLSLMARYSNQHVLDWWNAAVERMQRNGDFRRLCLRSEGQHGARGELHCAT